jgi:hypothetical protein
LELGFLFTALIYIEIPLIVSTLSRLDTGANNEDHGRDGRTTESTHGRGSGGQEDKDQARIERVDGGIKSWCVWLSAIGEFKYLIIRQLAKKGGIYHFTISFQDL